MRILFVGNSYTYVNDLPSAVRRILSSQGVEAETESVTSGGYTLAHFVSENNPFGQQLRSICETETFDFVVLQENSRIPAESPQTFFRSLSNLLPIVLKTGAKPVLYETWGRADGHETLVSKGWTHEEMQTLLRASYEQAAEENGILIAHAGDRFSEAYRAGVNVFDPDGSHPSPEGTEINASEIARVLLSASSSNS